MSQTDPTQVRVSVQVPGRPGLEIWLPVLAGEWVSDRAKVLQRLESTIEAIVSAAARLSRTA